MKLSTEEKLVIGWAVLCAGVLIAWMVVLLGCGGAVPRERMRSANTPWCFSFAYEAEGHALVALTCWQARNVCNEASTMVVKYGRLAHVTSVGECEEE